MTSSDCLKASLHHSPHTRHLLCFGISISPHPMGYVLNHLEISELALRDSVAKCRTVKKKISMQREISGKERLVLAFG